VVARNRFTRRVVFALVVTYLAATAARFYARKYYIFTIDYVRWMLTPAETVHTQVDIFFVFTDHFEPNYDAPRVKQWGLRYQALASRHRDRGGRPVQHTWFYPGEQSTPEVLSELRDLVAAGLGEVELHYHHSHDTEATLRVKLQRAIRDFQQYGFLKTADGRTHFAFIHGNFGLDDSIGRSCGVRTELRLLRELGCFCDFTFPSIYWTAQPPFVNTIYAAQDDEAPKSYARRLPVPALFNGTADLMIFEGPLVFRRSWSVTQLFLELEDGNIHPAVPVTPSRVDSWIRANVHLPERPDWVFIKVWGHTVSTPADMDEALGSDFDQALSYLESRYNDGQQYRLHYVTAREAYNLAVAAAMAETGPAEQYLDTPIPRYVRDAITED